MTTSPPISIEAKAFVPARDFELSKRFYRAIGFTLEWETPGTAGFQNGPSRFLLQDFYVPEHANNFMMSLLVDDVEAWWRYASAAAREFGIDVPPPEDRPWGLRDFTLFDPTGVLWRIAQPLDRR